MYGSSPGRVVLLSLALSAVSAAQTNIWVSPEWNSAERLPEPINSAGWEDSAHILPDGKTLYFTYFRADLLLGQVYGTLRVAGPERPGWPTVYPYNLVGADLHVASYADGQWQTPANLGLPVNRPEEQEGDVWVSADGKRMLFSNGVGGPLRRSGIYYSESNGGLWTAPILASQLGFPFVDGDENPHLTLDEKTLFFESRRPGGYGAADIWMSKRVRGAWQPPVNLGPGVNTEFTEGSPFSLDGTSLYFDDKGSSAIFRSMLQPDGSWSPRQAVVVGNVGDPSLTLSGDLYFVALSIVTADNGDLIGFDANIMVARKK